MAFRNPMDLTRIAGATVLVAGALVLLGWMLDIAALKSVVPGRPKMAPLTAVCLLLTGVSLWCVMEREGAMRLRISRICTAVAALIGLAQLCNLTFGWGLQFDLLGSNETLAAGESPARMAPATAAGFGLLTVGICCARTDRALMALWVNRSAGGSVLRGKCDRLGLRRNPPQTT